MLILRDIIVSRANNNGVFCQLYALNEDSDKVPGYIVFKINHKPIPEVENEVNIHQLQAANVYLTEELEKKTKEVEELKRVGEV